MHFDACVPCESMRVTGVARAVCVSMRVGCVAERVLVCESAVRQWRGQSGRQARGEMVRCAHASAACVSSVLCARVLVCQAQGREEARSVHSARFCVHSARFVCTYSSPFYHVTGCAPSAEKFFSPPLRTALLAQIGKLSSFSVASRLLIFVDAVRE